MFINSVIIAYFYWVVLSCVFSCVVCQYASQEIGWEDYTPMISFLSMGFAVQRPDWLVVYCNGYSRHVTFSNFLINFNLLTATYSSKARYSLFVRKVPLDPNQSIRNLYGPPAVTVLQLNHIAEQKTTSNIRHAHLRSWYEAQHDKKAKQCSGEANELNSAATTTRARMFPV